MFGVFLNFSELTGEFVGKMQKNPFVYTRGVHGLRVYVSESPELFEDLLFLFQNGRHDLPDDGTRCGRRGVDSYV